jgi:hypothetical protein
MTDVYFNKLFSYGSNYQSSFQLGIPTFLFLGIIYVVGQYLILQFIRNKSKLVRTNPLCVGSPKLPVGLVPPSLMSPAGVPQPFAQLPAIQQEIQKALAADYQV